MGLTYFKSAMKSTHYFSTMAGVAICATGSVLAQPFDDGTRSFSGVIAPYVQQAAQRNQPDTGLSIDVRSRIGLHVPGNGAGRIDWVSRINGNFAFESDQSSRRLHQVSTGPQWSFSQSKGRVWVGAALGFEGNGSSAGRQKLAGFNAGWYTPGLFTSQDAFQTEIKVVAVDPIADAQRLAIAGNMSGYRRWDAQVLYRLNLDNPVIPALTLGYEHFQQAGVVVGNSALGRNRLGSIRFDLPRQFYVTYDRGSSPLDTYRGPDNTTWRLGWEYRLH